MVEEKKFIGLNAMHSLHDCSKIEMSTINSGRSLLDFDSIIINPELFFETYKPVSTYEDISVLDWDDSRRIVEVYDKVKNSLNVLLQQGKNVYVFVGSSNVCYRYTGEIKYGRRSTEIELFNLYSFLPVEVSLEAQRGMKFDLVDNTYKNFYLSVKRHIEYHSVINVDKGIPFLKIKGLDKVVGVTVPYLNGKIIFLPYFCQEALLYYSEGYAIRQTLFDAIYALEESLTKKEVVEYPEWIDNYNILSEADEIENLNGFENEMAELQKRIEKQKACLDVLKKYKGLFTSTGHQLENIVKEVLIEMGFEIHPSDSRRSDVIAKYQDLDVVIEVKGIKKSATEEYARQLEAWNSDFWTETKKVAKCILIVNGFLDKKLEERKEPVFPDAMLKYCIGHEQCLITTTQLLCLFIEITDNPDCKDERVKELLNTVGIYNRYTDYTPFIKKVK
ncbi:MAG: hypothetical protein SPM09_11200 [Fibrobacter sp.]|uniref:hypothetical protein n=1 Tax=Fibrobacter sp. TaxID=35828 RepID=UPI002A91859D|nr:hypothetical protein [Fibrobacter sp.]MDY6264965.1 hypothetical protein [Fibrobacter sp.]